MEKFIHVKCNEKVYASINGQKKYMVSKNQPLDIVIRKNCYISFMPINDEFLPYSLSIDDIKNNDNILKIPYKDNHTDIYFIPTLKLTNLEEVLFLDKKYDKHYVKAFSNTYTYINITDGNYNFTKKIPQLISCDCTHEKHLILNGKLKNNEIYYLIFDLENNKIIVDDIFEIVEKENEKLRLMKNTQNIARHGLVYEYDINHGSIDKYSIYIDDIPHKTNLLKAIPYAFIESIKLQDYNLAKSYLQDTFVSNEHLKAYFGDIKEIFANPYSHENNYTILNSNGYKSYTFEIKDNKIVDIEEVQLY